MTAVAVPRELLARLQERLDPHLDARDWGMICDALAQQPATGGEREAFEAWVRRDWPAAPLHYVRDSLPKDDPRYGEYCNEHLQRAWVGWQARASLAAVPADHLQWMAERGARFEQPGAPGWFCVCLPDGRKQLQTFKNPLEAVKSFMAQVK